MRPNAPRTTSSVTNFVTAYYVLTIVLGVFVLSFHGTFAFAVDLIVAVVYLATTAILYECSKQAPLGPAGRN